MKSDLKLCKAILEDKNFKRQDGLIPRTKILENFYPKFLEFVIPKLEQIY